MSSGPASISPASRSIVRWIPPAIVLFWSAMTVVGPLIAPYDAAAIQDADLFDGMSPRHLLGIDYLGRDMLSRILAGPWATQILADMGAEVLKVEKPGAGDDTRGWGPPFLAGEDGTHGDAAYYLAANRGKKSLAVDIADPRGAAVESLAGRAAVSLIDAPDTRRRPASCRRVRSLRQSRRRRPRRQVR